MQTLLFDWLQMPQPYLHTCTTMKNKILQLIPVWRLPSRDSHKATQTMALPNQTQLRNLTQLNARRRHTKHKRKTTTNPALTPTCPINPHHSSLNPPKTIWQSPPQPDHYARAIQSPTQHGSPFWIGMLLKKQSQCKRVRPGMWE